MPIELIDTHCHLSTLEHSPLEEILSRAAEAHVTRYVCIGAGSVKQSASDAIALAERYEHIWASVGVHPHDAGASTDVSDLEPLAAHSRVVAVGETGLDFFRDWAPKENQQRLFENTIALARNCKKPLIIHCRDAADDCLRTLVEQRAHEVGGVFHCYAQDAEFAKRLGDINFLVSFPGSLTFKSANLLRETAKAIPLEQIMLETDAPYMAPEPYRGKPSEPAHVLKVAEKLAEVKELTLEQIAEVTTKTARTFFRI
ncbi:MAG: TatD family hydrolase [Bdellovibrionota bacterium]